MILEISSQHILSKMIVEKQQKP